MHMWPHGESGCAGCCLNPPRVASSLAHARTRTRTRTRTNERTYSAEVREAGLAVGFAVGDEQVDVGRELSGCGVGPVAKLALHILEAHGLVHTHNEHRQRIS